MNGEDTILVCTDFSAAAAVGEREAARRWPRARLVLFHAVDPRLARRILHVTRFDGLNIWEELRIHADQRLAEVSARLTSEGHDTIPELVEGDPVDEALAAARRHHARVIVLGAPAGVEVGQFRTRLLRRTDVPVLIIPSPE